MKALKKTVKLNGRTHIYFCGIKILSYISVSYLRKGIEDVQKLLGGTYMSIDNLKEAIEYLQAPTLYNQKYIPTEGIQYIGNDEIGLITLQDRYEQPLFEYEDMVICNQAIGNKWIAELNPQSIINIGCGVGTFEHQNAARFPHTQFVASEFDTTSLNWAKENRSYSNVTYCTDAIQELLEAHSKFDLAVCIDVIEHIKNYKAFLDEFVLLSDRAVITTPNRDRYVEMEDLEKPPYLHHTHEWNVGEFYFILKMYYKYVYVFSIKDVYNFDEFTEVGIYSTYHKLYAYCSNLDNECPADCMKMM